MDLYGRFADRGYSIANGDTRMRKGCRIDDEQIIGVLLDGINDCCFAVGLHDGHPAAEFLGCCTDFFVNLIEGSRTIDTGFPLAEQVKVRPMYDQYLHDRLPVCRSW